MSVDALASSTRERLLRSAHELIEEEGYAAASVVAIAGRAGLATGTLYRHFPSKAELFVELFRAVCDRELDAMREAAAAANTPVAQLEAVFATFAERALQNPRLAWALIAEPVDPLVDAERLAYRRRYGELTELLLREAIATGEVPVQNASLTAAALVGGGGEALVGPLSPLSSYAPAEAEIVTALRAFVRRAIGATAAASAGALRSGPR
jgi:AcrR family transcriptional regulator